MSNSDQQKPGGKSGKRKQKQASKKTEQQRSTEQAKREPIETAVAAEAPEETVGSTAAVEEATPAEPAERVVASFKERMASVMAPSDTAPDKPAAPSAIAQATVPSPAAAQADPDIGLQALANAYRDYTKKSLEDARFFAERLSAARSFDKAVEAQTEFAKKACETFVADSRKIRELHRELFWQTFRLPNWPLGRTPR